MNFIRLRILSNEELEEPMEYKKGRFTMKKLLYKLLRISNDINAVVKGKIGKRIINKAIGRSIGRLNRK